MNMIWGYVFQDMSYHLPAVFGTDKRSLVECFVGKQIMMNIYCVDKVLLCFEHSAVASKFISNLSKAASIVR